MRIKQTSEHFVFKYDEDLQPVVDIISRMTNYNMILNFFGLKKFRKVTANLFNNQNEFLDFLQTIKGKDVSIPSYCKGTFDNDMINISLLPNQNPMGSGCSLFHELVHIIYREQFYKTDSNRVVWFDEGLAQAISGQKAIANKEFMAQYVQTHIVPHKIPKLSVLKKHGNGFENENYSGYAISFLCVRYLLDTCTKEQFQEYLKKPDLVKTISDDLPQKATQHYFNKC